MKNYYIPRTSWFSYHEMDAPRIQRAIEIAGGQNIRLIQESPNCNLSKLLAFSSPEEIDVSVTRLIISRALNNQSVSVYELQR
jgi:hypothetical protein